MVPKEEYSIHGKFDLDKSLNSLNGYYSILLASYVMWSSALGSSDVFYHNLYS